MINLGNMKKSYLNHGDIIGSETEIIDCLLSAYKGSECTVGDIYKEVATDHIPLLMFGNEVNKIDIADLNIYVAIGIENNYINLTNCHDLLDVIGSGVYSYVYIFLKANTNPIIFNYALNYINEEHKEDLDAIDITEDYLEHELCKVLPFYLQASFSRIDIIIDNLFSNLKKK